VGRTGLSEDVADPVDRLALRKDQDVVDEFAVDLDVRQVADNNMRPAVARAGERGLLGVGEPAYERISMVKGDSVAASVLARTASAFAR
jgi:hypothetical protein